MITSTIRNKGARKLLVIIFWLFVWQAIYLLVGEEILFVSPLQTLNKFAQLSFDSFFLANNSIFNV